MAPQGRYIRTKTNTSEFLMTLSIMVNYTNNMFNAAFLCLNLLSDCIGFS